MQRKTAVHARQFVLNEHISPLIHSPTKMRKSSFTKQARPPASQEALPAGRIHNWRISQVVIIDPWENSDSDSITPIAWKMTTTFPACSFFLCTVPFRVSWVGLIQPGSCCHPVVVCFFCPITLHSPVHCMWWSRIYIYFLGGIILWLCFLGSTIMMLALWKKWCGCAVRNIRNVHDFVQRTLQVHLAWHHAWKIDRHRSWSRFFLMILFFINTDRDPRTFVCVGGCVHIFQA